MWLINKINNFLHYINKNVDYPYKPDNYFSNLFAYLEKQDVYGQGGLELKKADNTDREPEFIQD